MSEAVGFIGLGNLGFPMARNLLERGQELAVYNRTASKAEPLRAMGARVTATPAEVVSRGGVLVTVLWDAEAVESLVTSAGLLERLGPGGVHVGMCTGSPVAARRLAALHAAHGCTYVEAPVFGRPEAAVARQLWMPVAGPTAAKDRVRPLLAAMGAQGIFDFGEEVGVATVVKLVGNFLIVSATRSMVEGLAMAEAAGADPRAVVAMLTETLFAAPIYQSYGKRIAEKTMPTQPSPIPAKDLGLFATEARKGEVPAPIAQFLLEMVQKAIS